MADRLDGLGDITRELNESREIYDAVNQLGEMTRAVNESGEMYRAIREAGEVARPIRDAFEAAKPLISAAENIASKIPASVASRPESVLDRTLDRQMRENLRTAQRQIDAVSGAMRDMERLTRHIPRRGW